MRQTTLCLLVREGEILLAMKKRGFGQGRWNGYGGKVMEGESLTGAAIREMNEEIGVQADEKNLILVGELKFYFKHKTDWDQQVNIFLIGNWDGQPSESEEMNPKWFSFEDVPYKEMWPDDKYWLPKVLAGKKVKGDFYFKDDGNEFERFTIREV